MINLRRTNARLKNTFTLEPHAVELARKIAFEYCRDERLFRNPQSYYSSSSPVVHDMKMSHTGVGYSFQLTLNNKKKSREDVEVTLFLEDNEVLAYALTVLKQGVRNASTAHLNY
jgi:hypothetical protein